MSYQEIEDRYSTGVYPKRDVVIVRGEGAALWDENGRRYVDCVGGHGAANLGHCNPAVVKAVQEQVARLTDCTEIFHNDARARCLRKLVEVLPAGVDRIFLCNSGTEAVEGALKFARMATGRQEIVAFMRGFHGRTMGALSATWDPKYREPFMPLVPGFKHVPYDNVEAVREAVNDNTAAILVEIVQGEGGVRPGSAEFLLALAEISRESGALLIVDEIQTGFGRTGKMFACQHYGLTPDIVCLAKSIAGGLPMGAFALGPRVQNVIKMAHGSTFGGNPVACAASVAAIQYIQDENLPARAAELGAEFVARLRGIKADTVREVRGLGLMVGVELRQKATPLLRALMDRGVLALPAGPTVVRFLPPLVIERSELLGVADVVAELLSA
ncbi:MAG: acetylornithine/succinylornithine family transaminase [Chloroflexi bacterium]|nr:acetylornithine/succinylornithine family transaminase [Chloroflexota bacterium]MCL5108314.1 acetylornithine/succinylornithine family transaminase [Chloroflexota bacterium]MDA8218268.1 acetylornithine/succinylornithine family transaminase [Dehalococcoidales bacterium]